MPAATIAPARTPAGLTMAAELFRTHASSLSVDLAYQDLASGLVGLPGRYAPPSGALPAGRIARSGSRSSRRSTCGAPIRCGFTRPWTSRRHAHLPAACPPGSSGA